MRDENNNDVLTDELRQAIDGVRREPIPEDARTRAKDRALQLANRMSDRDRQRRRKLLAFVPAGLAAMLMIGFGIWMNRKDERMESVASALFVPNETEYKEVYYGAISTSPQSISTRRARPKDMLFIQRDGESRGPGELSRFQGGLDQQRPPPPPPAEPEPHNTNDFGHIKPNPFQSPARDPLSTFSVDVDTASYSLIRQFIQEQRKLPPKDAVRIEELINYFDYDYPQPKGEHPVTVTPEVSTCPWNSEHRLVRIGMQARRIAAEDMPPRNLVFLIDVSGSMNAPSRLPLVKKSFEMLVEQLNAKDRVAIVVYAGESGLCLGATPGDQKETILQAVRGLHAGGSTNGASGIELAYKVARESFIKGGVNRVILATDGDFNVGVTSQGDLIRLVEQQRDKGVFLTALGYGMGNYKDSTIMKLADHGHGHYAYIDREAEARKVFVEEGAALVTLAQDVKIQVEFNPKQVAAYRLLGYEKRLMRAQDFNDDAKHAGVLGSGHRVTALYEIVPAGNEGALPKIDPLKYQKAPALAPAADDGELLTVKVRYKEPLGQKSKLLSVPVKDEGKPLVKASTDFRFASAVAGFGLVLRGELTKERWTLADAAALAERGLGLDGRGYRAEFVRLVKAADALRQANSDPAAQSRE